MAEKLNIEVTEAGEKVVKIPVRKYRELTRKAKKYEEQRSKLASGGSKRWANSTPEERKAHMAKLAEIRKAKK